MDELLSLRELCRELDLPEPDEAESERMSRMTRDELRIYLGIRVYQHQLGGRSLQHDDGKPDLSAPYDQEGDR